MRFIFLCFSLLSLLLPVYAESNTEELNQFIRNNMSNKETRARGQAIYNKSCLYCHGRNLEGQTGFNLVDYQWVHGNKPNEIMANIKRGFLKKGMPPFNDIYKDEELADVISYIYSQQRGWENLHYEIRPLTDYVSKDFDYGLLTEIKPTKKGIFENRLANFGISTLPYYAMTIEGDMNVPYGLPMYIYGMGWKPFDLHIEVDGKVIEKKWTWGTLAAIPPGKHKVRITYASTELDNAHGKNFALMLTDPTRKIYYAGLSQEGHRLVNLSTYELLANNEPKTTRIRIKHLSGSPIAVGLPGQFNYAFDTKSCAITGVWTGDFMDIGPNLSRRSNNAGFILGDWLMKLPNKIGLSTISKNKCQYQMMTTDNKGYPTFTFKFNGMLTELKGVVENNTLKLSYQFSKLVNQNMGDSNEQSITFTLPNVKNMKVDTSQEKTSNKIAFIPSKINNRFDITLSRAVDK